MAIVQRSSIIFLCSTLLAIHSGCSGSGVSASDTESEGDTPESGQDASPDAAEPDTEGDTIEPQPDVAPDTGEDTGEDADTAESDVEGGDPGGCPGRPRVAVDISPWRIPGRAGEVRLTTVKTLDDRIPGEVPEGRIGDFVLENDRARFLIGLGEEAISPCSYDGNLVDMMRLDLPGPLEQGDVLGEICLLINVGLTFAPECAEILSDGSDGLAALALTGKLEILDFLNIKQMIGSYLPGVGADLLPVDPDRIPPISLTITYLLRPGDTGITVLTALRNDGEQPEPVAASHLLMSGSTGVPFNPLGGTGGFGSVSLNINNIAGLFLPFSTYMAEKSSYGYVPRPKPGFVEAGLPFGGSQLGISGVTVHTFDTNNMVETLLSTSANVLEGKVQGFRVLQPGEVTLYEHTVFAGDGTLDSLLSPAYDLLQVPTQTLLGAVQLPGAATEPAVGAKVTAIRNDGTPEAPKLRTLNQAFTGSDGTFSMRLPPGDYVVRARGEGGSADQQVTIPAAPGGNIPAPAITIPEPAIVDLVITDSEGKPAPGRASLICNGPCSDSPSLLEEDSWVRPPSGWERIVAVGPEGRAIIQAPAGNYRLVVSRGITHSVWPDGAMEPGHANSGGLPLTLVAGETLMVDAEIENVIDLSGVLSGDFHIHAMASSDSYVSNRKRVMDFLTEGVDVMVSTDHDAISDFSPTIVELGIQGLITSMVGEEITTPNIGHFNAFPLVRDPLARKGGPIDWSNGPLPNLTPADLYQAVRDHSAGAGEQVIQINHAQGSGTIGSLKADVLTGRTYADREALRMPPGEVDPRTGDTGLWSDDFTAMEVMNGHSQGNFWALTRWWLTLASRGAPRTATAVTDTHGLYGDLGGSPRSWVFVPDGQDTPGTMEPSGFVSAVNAGRLIGSNGPFFRVSVENANNQTAGLGETLALTSGKAIATLHIETPEWMRVDTVDVYLNATDDLLDEPGKPGQARSSPLEPSFSVPIVWEPADLVTVAEGIRTHRAWRTTVQFALESDADAWVVFFVRGKGQDVPSMWPVINNGGLKPLAFSNPIFLDADGGGYDNPPLAQAARMAAPQPQPTLPSTPQPKRTLNAADLDILLHAFQCEHGPGAHDAELAPAPTKEPIKRKHLHKHSHPHSHPHSHTHPHKRSGTEVHR